MSSAVEARQIGGWRSLTAMGEQECGEFGEGCQFVANAGKRDAARLSSGSFGSERGLGQYSVFGLDFDLQSLLAGFGDELLASDVTTQGGSQGSEVADRAIDNGYAAAFSNGAGDGGRAGDVETEGGAVYGARGASNGRSEVAASGDDEMTPAIDLQSGYIAMRIGVYGADAIGGGRGSVDSLGAGSDRSGNIGGPSGSGGYLGAALAASPAMDPSSMSMATTAVPEPSTMALAGVALVMLGLLRRKR